MDLPDKIFLIGMPGSGKSTLGRQLADALDYAFIDLDEQIEEKEGMPIKDIFDKYDEEYFRSLEQETLRVVMKLSDKAVIATGGGTPCFHDNMEFINDHGLSIFLDSTIDELARRLQATNIEDRPKFAGADNLEEQLQALYNERQSCYSLADVKWNSEDDSFESLLATISKK